MSELYSIERIFRPQSRENLRRARKFTEVMKTGCLKFENQNAKRENSRGQHKVFNPGLMLYICVKELFETGKRNTEENKISIP